MQRPTSWMASLTLEIPQAPNPTPDWIDVSPISLKPTALKNLRSNNKSPHPLALSNPSWPHQPPHPNPKPAMSPTQSNWASTSASGHANTPSAPVTSEQSNFVPSWTFSSSLGVDSSQPTPQSNTPITQPISSLLYTIIIIPSKGNSSLTYYLSRQQPARFDRVPTSSSACTNMVS